MRGLVTAALVLGAMYWTAPPPPECPRTEGLPPLAGGVRVAGRAMDAWWESAPLEGELPAGSAVLVDRLGRGVGRIAEGRVVFPTAEGERTAARLLRTGDLVLLEGDGGPRLRILLLPPGVEPVPGDLLVAAGTGGWPEGTPLARVTDGRPARAETVAFASRTAPLTPR